MAGKAPKQRNDLEAKLAEALKRVTKLEGEVAGLRSALEVGGGLTVRQLVDGMPCPVFLKDHQGRFMLRNRAFADLVGKGRDVLGRLSSEVAPPLLAEVLDEMDQDLLSKGRNAAYEATIRKASGEYVDAVVHKTVLVNGIGQVAGLLGLVVDLPHDKRIADSHRERERRLRSKLDFILAGDESLDRLSLEDLIPLEELQRIQDLFAEVTGVGSGITDIQGRPITKPSNFSPVCALIRETEEGRRRCRLSDKAIGEMSKQAQGPVHHKCLGCGFADASAPIVVAGRHIANWHVGQNNILNVDEPAIREYAREIGADEDDMAEALASMESIPLDRFEGILEFLWVLAEKLSSLAFNNLRLERHISEMKRMQSELMDAKEKAEAASRVKSEFLAIMSHEIRTPLNGVFGMLQLMRENSSLDEKGRGQADLALDSARRLLTILNDILDLSRIEAGRLDIVEEPYSPSDVVRAVLSIFAAEAKDKGVALNSRIDENVPGRVLGDEGRTRQVLFNAVGNALKFTTTGAVTVSVRADLNREPGLAILNFRIDDTGIGIPREKLGLVFEAFTQADGSSTRSHGGVGLGLDIVKRLVGLMQGEVSLESEQGKGTTLEFTIKTSLEPATPERDGEQARQKRPMDEVVRPRRILLAEDDEVNRFAVTRMLEGLGHIVTSVDNGRKALESMEAQGGGEESEQRFDLVILDVRMPEMDGIQAARLIRASPDSLTAGTPIIALTAHAMAGDRDKFIKAGMDGYLAKPFELGDLIRLMDKVLETK